MGKSAPRPPDPYATAQAQGQMNADTARTQATLNRTDTFTPMGNVQNRNLGAEWLTQNTDARREAARAAGSYATPHGDGFDEATFRRELDASNPYRDQWRADVTLSPEQQRLYETGTSLSQGTTQLAVDQLPAVRNILAQPYARDDPDARDRATAGIMSRLEPQFQRDREGLESRLLSQGFVPGSEAYIRASDELGRARNDARLQAETLGLNESRAAAGFSNQQRAQQVAELGMLFGIGPGMQMPQGQQMAQVGINSPDLQGAVANNYNQRAQSAASTNGALFGLLGAGLGGLTGNAALAKRLFS